MSTFDPASFLDFTTTEESVKRPPIPAGDYLGVIGDIVASQWASSKDPTKAGWKFEIPLLIDVPGDVAEAIGLTEPTLKVSDSVMLDLTEAKALDFSVGKNGKLRKYRDATGNNKAGQSFNARMLTGHVVTVKITHREYPEGSGDLFENVAGIAART
jgi:hypothetical protein